MRPATQRLSASPTGRGMQKTWQNNAALCATMPGYRCSGPSRGACIGRVVPGPPGYNGPPSIGIKGCPANCRARLPLPPSGRRQPDGRLYDPFVSDTYDAVVVVGLGAMGSAALLHLAKARRGRVLGIDRFEPPHSFGSTHGETRITREALGKGPIYAKLLARSHELWSEIEAKSEESVFVNCGYLVIDSSTRVGEPENYFHQCLNAAEEFGVEHELLDAVDMRSRFPQFATLDDDIGYLERQSGFLRPEGAVRAQLEMAIREGANIRNHVQVLGIDMHHRAATLHTTEGRIETEKAVIAVGPWINDLLGTASRNIHTIYPQAVYWFATDVEPDQC